MVNFFMLQNQLFVSQRYPIVSHTIKTIED